MKRIGIIALLASLAIALFAGTPNMSAHIKSTAATAQSPKRVILDPGHGGQDHGFCDNAHCEKETSLQVALALAERLRKEGVNVILTRNQEGLKERILGLVQDPTSLDNRLKLIEKSKADLFISLHVNASSKRHRSGAVVYYKPESTSSQDLASFIQRELQKIPANTKRTVKPGNFYIINKAPVPSAVIEMGYFTHKSDSERLSTHEYQEEIAIALARGVNSYFNNPTKAVAADTSEPKEVHQSYPNKAIEDKAKTAITQLFKGPRQKNRLCSLPEGISVNNVTVKEGIANVDLHSTSGETKHLGSEEESLFVYSMAATLLEFPEIEKIGFTIDGKTEKTLAGHIDISRSLTRDNPYITRVSGGLLEGKKAKVALVIDDFGQYNNNGVTEMFSIERPLTCAVMPNLENTKRHALGATATGHEVIAHLPMQPVKGKKNWLGPGAITSDMTIKDVKEQAKKDFEDIPYAVGFNNHMGSQMTARENIVRAIMEVAEEKELFVLDSRTSPNSKIGKVAEELKISHLERAVFLDDVHNTTHMKKQLNLLADTALAQGSAVGIGHVGVSGKKMAAAIREMIPVMEAKGVEFVYLSDLAY